MTGNDPAARGGFGDVLGRKHINEGARRLLVHSMLWSLGLRREDSEAAPKMQSTVRRTKSGKSYPHPNAEPGWGKRGRGSK